MKMFRVTLATGLLAAAMGSLAPAYSQAGAKTAEGQGLNGFDFHLGEWRVHHRRTQPDSREWVEFEGTCSVRKLLGGQASLEEHTLQAPRGAYQAIGIRSFDPKSGEWSLRWLDARYPDSPLDPPTVGRFENGVGTFYSDYDDKGKPMKLRFIWSQITPTSARWEQASSGDGGKTWETTWIMTFRRVS